MKGLLFIGIVLFGLVSSIYGDLTDNFESYTLNTWPSSNWVPDGNAKTDTTHNTIALDPANPTNQVLKLYGVVGSFWAALTYNAYSFPTDYVIEASVFNGTEVIPTSGHEVRASIGMRNGVYWNSATNPVRNLILFHKDGHICAGDYSFLGTYETDRWYDVKIHYQRIGDDLLLEYWLDGSFLGDRTSIISNLSIEESLDHIELAAGAGSAYFDDIHVSPVPIPGAVLLGAIGLSMAGLKLRKRICENRS